jgi:transposase
MAAESLLKRYLKGTHVSVEPFHLFRYLDEEVFRFNLRKWNEAERFVGCSGRSSGYERPRRPRSRSSRHSQRIWSKFRGPMSRGKSRTSAPLKSRPRKPFSNFFYYRVIYVIA